MKCSYLLSDVRVQESLKDDSVGGRGGGGEGGRGGEGGQTLVEVAAEQ